MTDRDEALAAVAKPSLKQRLTALFEEYGKIAIITYFTLSGLAIIGFSVAIWIGAQPSTATGVLGVLFAGWALAKATMPLRILAMLGLTPVIATLLRRNRRASLRGGRRARFLAGGRATKAVTLLLPGGGS
jgi:hypothetical protein